MFGALAFIILFLHFVPTIIAFRSKNPKRWTIFVINTLFGITLIGYLIALSWAISWAINAKKRDKVAKSISNDSSKENTIILLEKYNNLRINGAISEEEYQEKKREILLIS
jgi:hypothetical protein